MTGRRRLALTGWLALLIAPALSGCDDSLPPPPSTGDTSQAWPDEVKQAEAKFAEKAAARPSHSAHKKH